LPTEGRLASGRLKAGIVVTAGTGGSFAVRIDGVSGSGYSQLVLLPKPKGTGACDYKVSLEARFVPDPGNPAPPIGFVVGDVRGWAATRSAVGLDGVRTDWKAFQEPYHGLPDTTAITVQMHLDFGTAKVSGRLEVRGFQIEAISAPVFPAYSLLTALASLSEDGKTLHLIVFNKSEGLNIPVTLHLAGFHAASGSIWEVNGPYLGTLGGVTDTVQGAPLDMTGGEPVHVFPAHSLTAIDFAAKADPQTP
jgi:alpha-N-arabinofuranosidase